MSATTLRIGQGFDLHQLKAGRPFVLGGLAIDFPKGPVGHSDGDVLLHATVDALLGATGQGDIGEWFPDTDAQYKDADSMTLLNAVVEKLFASGWHVVNLDSTIFLEAPKLSPHKKSIEANLASALDLSPDSVCVKAKTMEQLGPIGQGDAIAAMVTVLMSRDVK